MELLQLREKEIFETLKKLEDIKFVVIGGYAVNAYTLPRFSADCDVVIKDKAELAKLEEKLSGLGYSKILIDKEDIPYSGSFLSYKKEIIKNFRVSVDVLFKKVLDRQTNAVFSADWIFKNSKVRNLKGKTIGDVLKLRIINVDALFVMKLLSCRSTDIRDLFMLVSLIKDKDWVKQEVYKRFDFNNRFIKLKKKISSKQFKDGLQGVFGFINQEVFDKYMNLILKFNK